MLDKSLPFESLIMRIESDKIEALPEAVLPDGFSFRFFEPSDEKHWASIETSAGEFPSEEEALTFFNAAFMPYVEQLKKRCFFILNSEGVPIANSSAMFAESELGYQPCVHWVAVRPEYQGMGLGKLITIKTLNIFRDLDPGKPVWLHTQTWSWPAIRLYHKLGFNIVKDEPLANNNTIDGVTTIRKSGFDNAIEVLKTVFDEDYVNELKRTAV